MPGITTSSSTAAAGCGRHYSERLLPLVGWLPDTCGHPKTWNRAPDVDALVVDDKQAWGLCLATGGKWLLWEAGETGFEKVHDSHPAATRRTSTERTN
jgi:hypothetical protein